MSFSKVQSVNYTQHNFGTLKTFLITIWNSKHAIQKLQALDTSWSLLNWWIMNIFIARKWSRLVFHYSRGTSVPVNLSMFDIQIKNRLVIMYTYHLFYLKLCLELVECRQFYKRNVIIFYLINIINSYRIEVLSRV